MTEPLKREELVGDEEQYLTADVENLIEWGAHFKAQLKNLQRQKALVERQLASKLDFGGKKSTKIANDQLLAKVQLKEYIKYDQAKLAQVDEHFHLVENGLAKTEIVPAGRKINALAAKDPEFSKALNWCRTITPAPVYVQYQPLDADK